MRRACLVLRILFLAWLGVAAEARARPPELVVGGKAFTEQLLLAEMTAQLLGAHGFKIDKREGMGSTILRQAQLSGQVDIYWEYTGTSLITYNKVTARLSPAETYRRVKTLDAAKGLTWLAASDANNTYALAVRADDARTASLKSLSDLAAAYNAGADLLMAVGAEFPRREDGLPGLEKTYGFHVGRPHLRPMQNGLVYLALKEDYVDLASVFSTDGRIPAFGLRLLEDDRGFFPNYALAPVVRSATLKAHPRLKPLLESLSAALNNARLQALNRRIDVDHQAVAPVARRFLLAHGLLEKRP